MTWTTWQYNTSYFARKYGQKLKLDKFQVDFTLIMGAMYWFLENRYQKALLGLDFVIKCNSVSVQVIRVLHPG